MADMNVINSPKPRSVSDVPAKTVHEYLLSQAQRGLEKHGDHTWMEDVVDGHQVKLSDVGLSVRKVASGLSRIGYGRADVLCMFARNLPQYFYPVLAAWSCGGCVTCANPKATTGQLTDQLKDSQARMLVCDSETLHRGLDAVRTSGVRVHKVFLLGTGTPPEGVTPISDLLLEEATAAPPSVVPNLTEDVVYLAYSSGTTGLPKGVMHTHFSLVATLSQFRTAANLRMKVLLTNHFFHVSGMFFALSWLGKGTQLLIASSFTEEELLKAIHQHKPSALSTYTHQVAVLSKSPLVNRYDLSCLTTIMVGGGVLPANTHRHIGIRVRNLKSILQFYGLTESLNVCTTLPMTEKDGTVTDTVDGSDEKTGCIGHVSSYASVKIVHPTGSSLGAYQTGEIYVKSPCTMKGYLNKPEETSLILDHDGWLKTGDLGYHDGQGCIYYVDRVKELIKYESYQVAPVAIEALLLQHPGVEDAAVVGIADDHSGELPRAHIVRSSSLAGRDLSKDELINFVKDNVADYEQLRGGLVFVNKIPRNPNGKILRRELKNYSLW